MASKTTTQEAERVETVVYTYNLQNRLASVTTAPYVDNVPQTEEVVIYRYNPDGIRISKDVDGVVTDYLIDPYNHTGYAQVLEEVTVHYNAADVETDRTRIQYTIGDDVLAQAKSTSGDSGANWTVNDPQYLLYDGHGSTRQLARPDKSVIDSYSYDGYGVMLSSGSGADVASNAATSLLYSGEQYGVEVGVVVAYGNAKKV